MLLVEELGLRTQRIEPMIGQLEQFSARIDQLKGQIEQIKREKKSPAERKPLLVEFRNILRALQETPSSLRNRIAGPEEGLQRVSAGQARPAAKATCGWSCRSPRSTATAACRSWT